MNPTTERIARLEAKARECEARGDYKTAAMYQLQASALRAKDAGRQGSK